MKFAHINIMNFKDVNMNNKMFSLWLHWVWGLPTFMGVWRLWLLQTKGVIRDSGVCIFIQCSQSSYIPHEEEAFFFFINVHLLNWLCQLIRLKFIRILLLLLISSYTKDKSQRKCWHFIRDNYWFFDSMYKKLTIFLCPSHKIHVI